MAGDFTDEELISYFDLHGETDRALFSREHFLRFCALSDSDPNRVPAYLDFITWHASDMQEALLRARAKLAEKGRKP